MTERDEQGFVKDIEVAIDEINNENKNPRDKFKELIELPFRIEDVISVDEYVKSLFDGKVDSHDELYSLALINEQMNGLDEIFKSKFEGRHKELVEALMKRMDGEFNMYDENLNENGLTVDPTVEQPVEVPTPQLDEINPNNLVEPMEVVAREPIATFDAPEMVDPTLFAEPTSYGEVPTQEEETETALNDFAAPVEDEVEEPVEVAMEEPTEEVNVPSFEDFINSAEVNVEPETPVEENNVVNFEDFINNIDMKYEEPEVAMEAPAEEETPVDNIVPMPEMEASVDETPNEEVESKEPEVTDEDEEVQRIINRYDRLKDLEIKILKDEKLKRELEARVEELKTEISNNQEEVKKLVA